MTIAAVKLYRYTIPLTGSLLLRSRRLERRTGYLIELRDEAGNIGYGEAAPLPGFSREWVYETKEQLQACAANLAGREADASQETFDRVWPGPVTMYPSVRFCLYTALRSLAAAGAGSLFGPVKRPHVTLNALVTKDMRWHTEGLACLRDAGYRTVKIKVGGNTAEDDARFVREAASLLGDDVCLRLDANRSWTCAQALRFALGVSDCNVEYIEEPARSLDDLRAYAGTAPVPFALDETLVDEAIEDDLAGRAAAWVIKPTLGGMRIVDRAMRHPAPPTLVVSSSYESGYGLAALVLLAASLQEADVPAGLNTYGRLQSDILAKPLPLPAPLIRVDDAVASMQSIDLTRCEEVDW